MFIINAGPGFQLLWNTEKTFLDPTTIAKIHVLGSKYRRKLLEVIDARELPELLGGSCTCSDQGGCLRSDKGPWKNPNILRIIQCGEAQSSREMAMGEKSDEGLVSGDKASGPAIRSGETSAAESGSEMDDISSPKAERGKSSLAGDLAPVSEETSPGKIVNAADEPLPNENVVGETARDAGSEETVPVPSSCVSEGISLRPPSALQTSQGSTDTRSLVALASFFMVIIALFQALAFLFNKCCSLVAFSSCNTADTGREPSVENQSSSVRSLAEADLLSPFQGRLDELEKNLDMLLTNPSSILHQKEEQSNASACPLDALEAELISTKKALFESLIRQEEIIAYISKRTPRLRFYADSHHLFLEAPACSDTDYRVLVWSFDAKTSGTPETCMYVESDAVLLLYIMFRLKVTFVSMSTLLLSDEAKENVRWNTAPSTRAKGLLFV